MILREPYSGHCDACHKLGFIIIETDSFYPSQICSSCCLEAVDHVGNSFIKLLNQHQNVTVTGPSQPPNYIDASALESEQKSRKWISQKGLRKETNETKTNT